MFTLAISLTILIEIIVYNYMSFSIEDFNRKILSLHSLPPSQHNLILDITWHAFSLRVVISLTAYSITQKI